MKIPDPIKQQIFDIQAQLLDLIDDAATTERELFDIYGETEQTLGDLDSLTGIREQAEGVYQGLNTLALRVVQALTFPTKSERPIAILQLSCAI